jgi:CHAT domain-containing protein/tetratricopeptide (TPR) repeat protein
LKSSQEIWQKKMARKLAAPAQERETKRFGWPRWALAGAAVLLIVAGGWWTLRALRPASAEQLLAEAYTEQRPFELRIPGAQQAPVRVERGGSDRSRLSRPPALLEAEARIARELVKHPGDAQWLAARGRAELLDWNYEAAIQSFKRVLEAEPDSPPVLTDLATAYFQRAEARDRAIDYGMAIELLGQSLAKKPDDPVALFNRAIAAERMYLYQQAISDWENYLRVDPQGAWASEAKQRLEALKKKLKAHEDARPVLLTDPAAFARWAASQAASTPATPKDSLDEDYLDTAVIQWLPALYSPGGKKFSRSPPHGEALTALAARLESRHDDLWLHDLLATPPSESFASGLIALGNALQADAAGDPVGGEKASGQAAHLFQVAGSDAGAIRARLERLHSLERSLRADLCVTAAQELVRELTGHRYPWVEADLQLERASCTVENGDSQSAKISVLNALRRSEAAGYRTLHLRCLGLKAGMEWDAGQSQSAYALNRAGLAEFWAGTYPPLSAYRFSMELAEDSEDARQWNAAHFILKEVVQTVDASRQNAMRAIAHNHLAVVAEVVGATPESIEEFSLAGKIFSELPQTPVTKAYDLDSQISLASIEMERRQADSALRRLEPLREDVARAVNSWLALHYYQTLGEVQLRRGQTAQAEMALRAAVHISESRLQSSGEDPGRLDWDRYTAGAYRGLVELRMVNQKDPAGALRVWEWYRTAPLRKLSNSVSLSRAPSADLHVDFESLAAGPPLPPMPDVAASLRQFSGETIISYAKLSDRLVIWAFDDRGMDSKVVPLAEAALDALATRFSRECADSGSDLARLRADGRQIYDLIVAPVAARLDAGRTLVIEPDGALGQIPFQALVEPSGDFLGSRFAITSSPGIGYEKAFHPGIRFSTQQRILVVGAPAFQSGPGAAIPALPDANREAEAVAARFTRARLFTGAQASRDTVQRELALAEIFHFAGHAVAGAGRSGLLLAGRGEEAGADLYGVEQFRPALVRFCRLVVLSACSTDVGERGLADPESLVRAFLAAGVPHVLAARWDVDSRVTARFADAFYTALLSGLSVPRAAQKAALEIRSNRANFHPYYWAALTAFGSS